MEWNGVQSVDPRKNNTFQQTFHIFLLAQPGQLRTLERARKGGIGGVKDSRISIKKKAVAAVEAVILMLGKGWNPFTNAYIDLGVQVDLTILSPISKCLDVWVEHREESLLSFTLSDTVPLFSRPHIKNFVINNI